MTAYSTVKSMLDTIITHYPLKDLARFGITIQAALADSIFSGSFSGKINQDADLLAEIIEEQLVGENTLSSLEVLRSPFFRGKRSVLSRAIKDKC